MSRELKGYYFSQIEENGLGPRKKVLNQIKAFKENGISLELVENPFCLAGKIRGNFILRQIVSRLPFTYVYSRHKYEERFRDADVYYVRFLAGDRAFVKFLRLLRKGSPESRIVMELADYPTTWYMTTSFLYRIVYFPIWLKDVIARTQYKKYIDRIAMLKPEKEVFGIPVIQFLNGIDVDSVTVREPQNSGVIKMIAVAGMCNFHGYDRLIEGMHQYYSDGGTREIELHLVGGHEAPGNELSRYRALCRQYGLEERVFFYGVKVDKELDDIYNQCNIAVASLGMSRIGYITANSLKIREYLAKGLPVITGCPVDVFSSGNFPYYQEFSNDETPIDMGQVVRFYDSIYPEKEGRVEDEIREYAKKYCDMSYAMKPVIDYLKETL